MKKKNTVKKTEVYFCILVIFLYVSETKSVDVHLELLKSPIKTEGYLLTPRDFHTKTIETISYDEIKKLPVNSFEELLDYFGGLDSQKRGPYNIQSDISVRGGSFEQTLILVDGVRVSDPQTGHFNLEIPLTLEDVDRVEILRGPGSSAFGPDAFSGAINIITKQKGISKKVNFSYGGYNTACGLLSLMTEYNNVFQRLSVEKTKSDGWLKKDNKNVTDFDITTISGSTGYKINSKNLMFDYGWLFKDFGAYDFYTPYTSADSRESTDTRFVKLSLVNSSPEFDIFYRRHFDRFIYKYSLNLGKNEHLTDVYGLNFRIYPFFKEKNLVFGLENLLEEIESTKFGKHSQTRYGLFSEYRQALTKKTDLSLGLRYDSHSNQRFGTVLSPSIGAGYKVLNHLRIRSSVSTGYRTPSFTELYYEDPSNNGNPELKPEKNISGEISFDIIGFNEFSIKASVFSRREEDIIDWGRYSSSEKWTARNISKINFSGVETKFFLKFLLFDVKTGYSYQRAESDSVSKNYESKYVLRYPEHLASAEVFFPFFHLKKVNITLTAVYKKRVSEDGYVLLNALLKYKVSSFCDVYLKGTNLSSTEYEEVLGVPQPGRWLTLETGLEF